MADAISLIRYARGLFNIIYIMRTNREDGGIWRSAVVLGLVISLRLCQLCSIITDAVVSNYAKRMAAPVLHQFRGGKSSAMTQDG